MSNDLIEYTFPDNDENTAAGSIEEANKKVKPHRTSSVEKYHFDKELRKTDKIHYKRQML